jgi:hypothetical protein
MIPGATLALNRIYDEIKKADELGGRHTPPARASLGTTVFKCPTCSAVAQYRFRKWLRGARRDYEASNPCGYSWVEFTTQLMRHRTFSSVQILTDPATRHHIGLKA